MKTEKKAKNSQVLPMKCYFPKSLNIWTLYLMAEIVAFGFYYHRHLKKNDKFHVRFSLKSCSLFNRRNREQKLILNIRNMTYLYLTIFEFLTFAFFRHLPPPPATHTFVRAREHRNKNKHLQKFKEIITFSPDFLFYGFWSVETGAVKY